MPSALGRVLVVGLVLCAHSVVALATEDPEALIREGVELRKQGQDARAEGYFRRAYELAKTARAAAQLGLSELAVGDYLHAEEHLSEALAHRDAWILQHLQVLEDSREVVRRNLFHVVIAGLPADAIVTIEGNPERRLPSAEAWLEPGSPATLRVEGPGRQPAHVRVAGSAGETRSVTLELRPVVQAPAVVAGFRPGGAADRTASAGRPLRIAGVTTAVVGVAAGIVGAFLYAQGTSELHEYQTAINSNGAIPWNPRDENWEGTRNAGVALLVVGGVGIAGGVSLFLLGNHERDAGEKVSLTAAPGVALFSYRGSF
jgi:hypothetical protein